MSTPVYLDYNATTPVHAEVAAAMARVFVQPGNASSVHRFGRIMRREVEDARAAVAALVGADPADVVFTGSGSEANNLALGGCAREAVLVSAIEHESVTLARPDAVAIPVRGDGQVSLTHLAALLARDDRPALVSVMLANNETGVLQPVRQIVQLANETGTLVHCDAIQAAGRVAIDIQALGVHMLSLSAHKIGGPQGVGALILSRDMQIARQIHGGGQERGRRAGTENVAGIVGFGVAATIAAAAMSDMAGITALRDDLEARALKTLPGVQIHGAAAERLGNTSCISAPGVAADMLVMAFDLAGVAVSAGSACSSGKVKPSHVLHAMGADDDTARGAIRVSLGWATVPADIDRFIDAWCQITGKARRQRGAAVAAPAA
ncbi:MAG: cysteine desulfurase family protein [Alphaproteobacteria bacterium]